MKFKFEFYSLFSNSSYYSFNHIILQFSKFIISIRIMIPLNSLSVNLFIEIINRDNKIGDEGASNLGSGISHLKDLTNLSLNLV